MGSIIDETMQQHPQNQQCRKICILKEGVDVVVILFLFEEEEESGRPAINVGFAIGS
jgi:hypothetical protein